MDARELRDRIETWLSFARDLSSMQDSNDPEVGKTSRYRKQILQDGLMINASELIIVDKIIGSPVEQHLKEAIEMAQSGDCTLLPQIEERLRLVQKWMYDNGIY